MLSTFPLLGDGSHSCAAYNSKRDEDCSNCPAAQFKGSAGSFSCQTPGRVIDELDGIASAALYWL